MQVISERSQASYLLLYPQVIFYQVFITKILKTEKKISESCLDTSLIYN